MKHGIFAGFLADMCKEMVIFIYIASLEHIIYLNIYEMDKIKIMGFHQPLYNNLWPPPYPNNTLKFHIKRCVIEQNKNNYIDVFGAVYWAKNTVFKKS